MALTPEQMDVLRGRLQQRKSASLPAVTAGQSAIGEIVNPFGAANRERLADIPSDVGEFFTNSANAIGDSLDNNQAIKERVTSGETTPLAGTLQTIGGGLKAGAATVGNAALGLGKLFTRQSTEDAIKKGVTDTAETVAQTAPVQEIKAWYNEQPDEVKRNLQGGIGVVEGLATMFGAKPVIDVLRKSLTTTANTVGAVTDATVGATARTAQEAANAVLESGTQAVKSLGSTLTPSGDILSGLTQQVGDFARRTANEAKDTAKTNQILATLPKEEAGIRRVVGDERVINVIKQAPESEISIYKELVEQAKRKEADPTPNTAQPKEIAGREFLKPVEYLISEKDRIGKDLGETRKSLTAENNINTNSAFRNFHRALVDNYQLEIKNGVITPQTGKIAPSDIKEIQKIYDELNSKTFTSQKDIDTFLQRTFKEYDLRQAREKTFSDDVPKIAEMARKEFRQLMPEDYNRLATEYATTLKPIQEVIKLLGYKGDLDKLTAKELKAGEVALRLLGNSADRPQSVIDDVLNQAVAQGYKSDIDLNRLIYITDQLEDLYDVTPTRGFSGSTARGIDKSGVGALGDAASLNIGGLFNRAMSSKASQQEVRDAFEAYLNSL